jgi:hypothetical protein
MLDESHRQRAMRPEVRISREALQVVQPINRRIGEWQARAAHLAALGQRAALTGCVYPHLRDDAETLKAAVGKEVQALAQVAQELPPAVAHSNRIEDTQRALAGIAACIERTLALFEEGGASCRRAGAPPGRFPSPAIKG